MTVLRTDGTESFWSGPLGCAARRPPRWWAIQGRRFLSAAGATAGNQLPIIPRIESDESSDSIHDGDVRRPGVAQTTEDFVQVAHGCRFPSTGARKQPVGHEVLRGVPAVAATRAPPADPDHLPGEGSSRAGPASYRVTLIASRPAVNRHTRALAFLFCPSMDSRRSSAASPAVNALVAMILIRLDLSTAPSSSIR